ncbi:MAG: PDR/VanB family oxidoreductase [Nocardioides sp.]
MTTTLDLVVTGVDHPVPGIRTVTMADPDGHPLPGFIPGSHVVVECGDRANAYSLISDGLAPSAYSISVLRIADGAGGSEWIHTELRPGTEVRVRLPSSMFAPIARATRHLLIAGGIGVTPILSHQRAARRRGQPSKVLYAFRAGYGAHLNEIRELTDDSAELFTSRTEFAARLEVLLTEQPLGTHLYVCGPAGFMDRVLEAAADAGWPQSRVHSERFSVDVLDPGAPFEVELTATGSTLEVPPGTSLLEALEAAGIEVPNLCRQGVCGECRIPVTDGVPLHRDLYLSDDERAGGEAMMACVSRSETDFLAVPL